MKKILQLALLCLVQSMIAQVSPITTFDYLTMSKDIVQIEIDTTNYKPQVVQNLFTFLRNAETDESISIDVNGIKENDTINNFERSKNHGEFIDLGKVDGYRTVILKEHHTRKGKEYTTYSYAKFFAAKAVVFTVLVPSQDFSKNEERYKMYARSMRLKKR